MGKGRFFSIATATVVALNLGAVTVPGVDAAQEECGVSIYGGDVQNATVLDVVADGGTAIGDASGGRGNLAVDAGNDRERDNGDNNRRNNRRNNRNNWSAESVLVLEERVLQTDTASAGNAGVATASADGGAVSIQDINSGGNAGNAISVGDTVCAPFEAAPEKKPSGGGGGYAAPTGSGGGGGRGGDRIRALPSTGVGELGDAESGSLILALGALGMMGLSVGSRLQRRDVRIEAR
jgi:hypothetical protein